MPYAGHALLYEVTLFHKDQQTQEAPDQVTSRDVPCVRAPQPVEALYLRHGFSGEASTARLRAWQRHTPRARTACTLADLKEQ